MNVFRRKGVTPIVNPTIYTYTHIKTQYSFLNIEINSLVKYMLMQYLNIHTSTSVVNQNASSFVIKKMQVLNRVEYMHITHVPLRCLMGQEET